MMVVSHTCNDVLWAVHFVKFVAALMLGTIGLAPDILGAHVQPVWARTYNGDTGGDSAEAIAVDAVGNVYVTGRIERWNERPSDENENWLTIKYDAEGNELWTAEYGSNDRRSEERPTGIAVNRYGEVFVTGSVFRDGPYRLMTLMYSPDGRVLWTNEFAGWAPYPARLRTDGEGNLYAGFLADALGVVKYSRDGRLLWPVIYPGHTADMVLDDAGNVYLTGLTDVMPSGRRALATLKLSGNGETNWLSLFQNAESNSDWGTRIRFDRLGNVFVTGSSSQTTNTDLLTIKYDASGNQLWAARYAAAGIMFEWAIDVLPDDGGGAYVVGTIQTGIGYVSEFLLVRYDADGREMWVRNYSRRPNSSNRAIQGTLDALGNVYVIGHADITNSHSAYDVVKYDSTGRQLWAERIDGPVFLGNAPHPLLLTSEALYMTGLVFTNSSYDFLTMRFALTNTVPVASATAARTRVVSPNARDALVELDGTRSLDADGDLLSFEWLLNGRTIGSTARLTKRVGVGTHTFTLVVSDGTASDSDTVTVKVVTAAQAVRDLENMVKGAPLRPGHERHLLRSLEFARISFEIGHYQAGIASLTSFQTYARRYSRAIGPVLAQQMIAEAATIISALQR